MKIKKITKASKVRDIKTNGPMTQQKTYALNVCNKKKKQNHNLSHVTYATYTLLFSSYSLSLSPQTFHRELWTPLSKLDSAGGFLLFKGRFSFPLSSSACSCVHVAVGVSF